jgi:hypothetical protein
VILDLALSDGRALAALVGFWIERCLPALGRLAIGGCGFLLLFIVTGSASASNISALLCGTGIACALPPVAILFRDKAAGDLEMVTGLPVRPAVISASLFLAAAVPALPGAIAIAAGVMIEMRETLSLSLPFIACLVIGTWILLSFVSWTLVAFGAALSETAFMNGPVAAIGILLLATALAPPIPPPHTIFAWLSTPSGSLIAGLVACASLALGAIGLYSMTRRGIERYAAIAAEPDQPHWRRLLRRRL